MAAPWWAIALVLLCANLLRTTDAAPGERASAPLVQVDGAGRVSVELLAASLRGVLLRIARLAHFEIRFSPSFGTPVRSDHFAGLEMEAALRRLLREHSFAISFRREGARRRVRKVNVASSRSGDSPVTPAGLVAIDREKITRLRSLDLQDMPVELRAALVKAGRRLHGRELLSGSPNAGQAHPASARARLARQVAGSRDPRDQALERRLREYVQGRLDAGGRGAAAVAEQPSPLRR